MIKQKLKGLWIPVEILTNDELSDKEKIILSMIVYLSKNKEYCFASNKYIANIVDVTPDRVSKIISSLKNKKYIDINLKYKTNTKEIESRQIKPIKSNIKVYSPKNIYPIGKNNYRASQKELYPIGENNKDIKYNIKNKNKYIERNYTDEELEQFYINA